MLINFDKLNADSNLDPILNPIQIFDVLPRKSKKYEEYLRDVQSTVLEKWFVDHREKKNTVIKMNTGSGKTVVGLLILKSYLNENKGPAVYIVPDNYLVEQVIIEATDLGIPVTKDPRSNEFIKGQEILITNMHRIINGRSVFGVEEIKQNIGCMIIDDAHACIKVAETQFSISIPRDSDLYHNLLTIFEDSIKLQSETRYLEIKDGEKGSQQLIPFWDWNQNLTQVRNILHQNKDNETLSNKSLFYNWPLVKDNLELANCIITGQEVLISLEYLPIEIIPSFDECQHRVFMSATIDDDSILISHFNIKKSEIEEAVTPKNANDIGERMILIPQEINPQLTEDQLKAYFKTLSKDVNVIVLVPSMYRAKYWEDSADLIVRNGPNLTGAIDRLKSQHVGMVVLINKYDGIDLPKSACEVLIVDGLPDVRSEFDKLEQIALRGSKQILKNTIHRIEQGMGRGIRSKDDHCVVFLMGNSLVQNFYHQEAATMFTEATRKQLELAKNLSSQMKDASIEDIHSVVKLCLERNSNWIETSRSTLVNVKYNSSNQFEDRVIKEREAFNNAQLRDYQKAVTIIQTLVNEVPDNKHKGYLKYKLAKYENFYNSVSAQQTIKSAKRLNNQLVHPIEGIEYEKVQFKNIPQANNINEFLLETYSSSNQFIITFNAIIDKLIFTPNSSNLFEQAIKELGEHLGYASQRPENEFGKGPDNLWGSVTNYFFVIECKNEAITETISKGYCNQLNGSIIWFTEKYRGNMDFTPILIHPSNRFERAASPSPNIRIINAEKLESLRRNLREYAKQVAAANYETNIIANLLKTFYLEPELFREHYTVGFVN
ncbi:MULTISPECIES: DEAD/DEAH box helicase family protein [unclassified Bacillus (in: firmicutes)]|uniref:DEAD/DEAH box helicase family protein n=1 Tax=unclassified Bacillus (in: firmicutes) TaxID=185979 RepID=UPI0023DBE5FC|nr:MULTISPECIES: DEAD/DEAH box helicase family protein [unclassified Bacillus (in: firmicutes)]MDF2020012.1 DEAD/DEAH box helicase family protein [Bacillus sp. Cr_R3]MDF2033516.1 DEAD/DEAH box helicase family protein [Bacillus sp. Cr_R16]